MDPGGWITLWKQWEPVQMVSSFYSHYTVQSTFTSELYAEAKKKSAA